MNLCCTNCILNNLRVIRQSNGLLGLTKSLQKLKQMRLHSTTSNSERVSVVVSKDGQTIYCWHPEPTHPYEHTRPMPRVEDEIKEGESVLKAQYLLADKYRFRPDGPTDDELNEMFSTWKYHFRLKPRRRFANENPPVDREGI